LSAKTLPGLAVAVIVAAVATLLARYVPLVGAPVLAIVIGVIVGACVRLPAGLTPGIAFSARTVLQGAIIVSGFALSFLTVVHTGIVTLPVTIVTIAVALVLAPIVGRLLGVPKMQQRLVGFGTAICGASAIAALATVLEPDEADIALAIATVFFYNVVAVLIFPPLGHLMGMTQAQFGVWAGTAINDTSSVVAAGYAYGKDAGAEATIVKLARATLILPLVGFVAFMRARAARSADASVPWRRIVPWFILWFLIAALIATTGIIPAAWHNGIIALSTFLIATALAAIGLQTQLIALLRAGLRPLTLGLVLWIAVALASLGMQRLTGL
jgi:uncharacterized integral membrane protein (TIGR00698 family)